MKEILTPKQSQARSEVQNRALLRSLQSGGDFTTATSNIPWELVREHNCFNEMPKLAMVKRSELLA